MGFTQTTRVWWNTTQPGASTSELTDADNPTTPPTDDTCSGVVGVSAPEGMGVCERSGWEFPLSQMTQDPNTGRMVGNRFVDPPAPVDATDPGRPIRRPLAPVPPIIKRG